MKLLTARKVFLLVIGLYLLACGLLLKRSRVASVKDDINSELKRSESRGNFDEDEDEAALSQAGSTLDDIGEGDREAEDNRDVVLNEEKPESIKNISHGALTNQEKSTLEDGSSWDEVQAARKKVLWNVCRKQPELNVNMTWIIHEHKRWLWPFIYNDKHRLIYCYVSKIASTNWKSAFLVLMGKYKRVEDVRGSRAHDPSLPKLSKLQPEEIEWRLKNYTKFLFVRDPLSRALSGYRSKFLQPNKAFQRGIGRRIIQMYRPNPNPESLKTGKDVTFPEFASYLSNAKPAKMDGHWKPIHDMVLPCGVHFDYIGKLETGHRDSVEILKRAHVDDIIYFKESTRNVSHDNGVFNSFYDQLKPHHVKGLYKQYELDFKLFDYTLPRHMREWVFGKH